MRSMRSAMIAAWLGTAAPVAAAAPRLGGGGDVGVSLLRIVTALVVCSVVALLAILLIRQRSGRTDLRSLFSRLELRQRAVEVVETRRLGMHGDISVVRHRGREYLLLLSPGGAQILCEGPAEMAASEDLVEQ